MVQRTWELTWAVWIYRILRVLYAVVFFYAGVNKLLNPESFAAVIEAFGLVPDLLIMPIAVTLPLLEVVMAFALFFDVRSSLAGISVLLLFFLAVVSYGIWMGLDIDCGCFGPGDQEGEAYKTLRPTFYRNIGLLAGVVVLYGLRIKRSFEPVRAGQFFRQFTARRKENESGKDFLDVFVDGRVNGRNDFGRFCKRQVRN